MSILNELQDLNEDLLEMIDEVIDAEEGTVEFQVLDLLTDIVLKIEDVLYPEFAAGNHVTIQ